MFITNKYRIELAKDPTFRPGSADNLHHYNVAYIPEEPHALSTCIGIKIYVGDYISRSIVIGDTGGATGLSASSFIIEEHRLVICCGACIFCLALPDLTLLWKSDVDDIACFGIYPYKDSYIIHGECSISSLSHAGQIIWKQYGADIFLNPDGESCCVLSDESIRVRDFEGRSYTFDYEGNHI